MTWSLCYSIFHLPGLCSPYMNPYLPCPVYKYQFRTDTPGIMATMCPAGLAHGMTCHVIYSCGGPSWGLGGSSSSTLDHPQSNWMTPSSDSVVLPSSSVSSTSGWVVRTVVSELGSWALLGMTLPLSEGERGGGGGLKIVKPY